MAVERDKKGRIMKGSGPLNPTGAPKKLQDISQMIKDSTDGGNACIKLYLEIMEDKKANKKDRIQCATKLLEYAYGRPSQQVNATVDTTGDILFRWAKTEEESK